MSFKKKTTKKILLTQITKKHTVLFTSICTDYHTDSFGFVHPGVGISLGFQLPTQYLGGDWNFICAHSFGKLH